MGGRGAGGGNLRVPEEEMAEEPEPGLGSIAPDATVLAFVTPKNQVAYAELTIRPYGKEADCSSINVQS